MKEKQPEGVRRRATNEYARVANDLAAQMSALSRFAYQRKQAEVKHARLTLLRETPAVSAIVGSTGLSPAAG